MIRKHWLIALFIPALLVITLTGSACQSPTIKTGNTTTPELKTVTDIPMSGGTNRWDYQSIDYENNRLYISHLGSSMVTIFDLNSQQVITDIPDIPRPFGILAVPSLKTVYVSAAGKNQVGVIDENSLKVVKYIQAGTTPDGIAYDPNTNKIFVSNENSGTITVIDAKSNERLEDIPVGGAVGNTQFDPVSKLIYSVSGADDKLIEIDPTTNKVVNKYAITGGSHPHGFYIDENTHYALITCQGNNKIIVFDLDTKKIIASDTVGANPDVLAFDPGLHRLYVAAESGNLTMFEVKKNKVTKIGQLFIAEKAHTVSVDKNTHRIYFPLENVNGKPVLRIMEPIQ